MKIVLISPVRNVTASNLRGLAAALAQAGHDVVQVFLPDIALGRDGNASPKEFPYETPLPAALVADIAGVCEDAGLVGVSLMTNHFERMADLTARLRGRVAAPIVWGGIHATVRPRECLAYADAVAVGEADETLPALAARLAAGDDWRRTAGFVARAGDDVIANAVPAPPAALGALPPPRYQPAKDFVQVRETARLAPLSDELLAAYTTLIPPRANAGLRGSLYMAAASRGCPHRCAYCSNAFLQQLHAGYQGIRWRPVGHVLAELAAVRERWSFFSYVFFSDDAFFAMPAAMLDEFAARYPKEVGLPFRCFTPPDTVTRPRLAKLVAAGLFLVEVGVQSAARRTRDEYRRGWMAREQVLAAARLIKEHSPALAVTYDLLADNPYEGDGDRRATLAFVSRLPRPFFLQTFSLTFYPGTAMYARVRGDGLLGDELAQVYRKNALDVERRDYLHFLTTLHNFAVPRALIRLAAAAPFVWLARRPPGRWAFAAATRLGRAIYRAFAGKAM